MPNVDNRARAIETSYLDRPFRYIWTESILITLKPRLIARTIRISVLSALTLVDNKRGIRLSARRVRSNGSTPGRSIWPSHFLWWFILVGLSRMGLCNSRFLINDSKIALRAISTREEHLAKLFYRIIWIEKKTERNSKSIYEISEFSFFFLLQKCWTQTLLTLIQYVGSMFSHEARRKYWIREVECMSFRLEYN